jgi:hypothetical protein
MINNTYRFLIDIHNLKTGKCHSVNFTVVLFRRHHAEFALYQKYYL